VGIRAVILRQPFASRSLINWRDNPDFMPRRLLMPMGMDAVAAAGRRGPEEHLQSYVWETGWPRLDNFEEESFRGGQDDFSPAFLNRARLLPFT